MRPLLALPFCLTVAFAACSGKVVNGGTGNAPVPLEQYCDRYSAALCSVVVDCCTTIGVKTDLVACKAEALDECRRDVSRSQSAGATYDPDTAGACIGAIRNAFASCRPRLDDPSYQLAERSCTTVFRGSVPLGGSCEGTSQCAIPADKEVSCVFTTASSVCAERIAIGGSCGTNAASCVRAAYCERSTTKCTAKKPEGATCGADSECAGGDCVSNVCRAAVVETEDLCRSFGQDVPPTVGDAGTTEPAPADVGP